MADREIFSDKELLSYVETHAALRHPFRSVEHMAYYLHFLLMNQPPETACLVLLGKNKRHLHTLFLAPGALYPISQYLQMLEPYYGQAAYFFMGHSHGDMPLVFSLEDIHTTRLLCEKLEGKITFLTHIITGNTLSWIQLPAV